MPLQKNKIHQGDCIAQLAKLEAGSVDLVFADPPFNIGYDYDVYNDAQSANDYLDWSDKWIQGVYHALKHDGTFWLAIGDEYAAELKIASQKAGFICRSWVIWYYTFGVNCANGFSRSHTHLFHFIKDPKKFTFVRPNPNVRVKSARQLVYADLRANPSGRLPDNTWITRPQDAPNAFRPNHDTWFFSRVAGTFSEREGFHGCQMPEQLLARIIRTSSNPYDLVLDPFGGSGTTLCVAKKLNRNFMGFELSKEYVKHITNRLKQTEPGDPIDGPDDPIESAPATAKGKRRKSKEFDDDTIQAVVESYQQAGEGYPADYLLCDKKLNKQFIRQCLKRGIGGSAVIWNRLLLKLRKSGKLPRSSKRPERILASELNRYVYASEVAWRLVTDEFGSDFLPPPSIDEVLCCPNSAEYFDQIAEQFGPQDQKINSLQFRRAALAMRKMAKEARSAADKKYADFSTESLINIKPSEIASSSDYEAAGVFLIRREDVAVYAGEAENLREHLTAILDNPSWQKFEADQLLVLKNENDFADNYALKSAIVQQSNPLLNSRVWLADEAPAENLMEV
ncbi:MAG: site-specific DNA-methyltransferase [Planctomycetota bacterium]